MEADVFYLPGFPSSCSLWLIFPYECQDFSGDLPKVVISILLIVSFAGTGFTMIKSHPFEDVYFNILLSKKDQYLRKTFELDYWGTSYKQALEYISCP